MALRILDIGQCGFDGPRMAALWHDTLGATVDRSASGEDALHRVRQHKYDVILVNRILAGNGESGLDVIRALKDAQVKTPIMLVSDYPDAQEEAVALGALPGFGKARLDDPAVLEQVRAAAKVPPAGETR